MIKLWMFTCEECSVKTATECDMFDAADVRCAMCGSALVGDKVDVVVISSERLAAFKRISRIAQWHINDGSLPSQPGVLAVALDALKRIEDEEERNEPISF